MDYGANAVRKITAAFLATTLSAIASPLMAQAPPSLPTPALPAAALPRQASAPGLAPTAAKETSYWKPAPPKPKPSALRRFFGRFSGPPRDLGERQEGMKVYRDPATGRTNTLNSTPWMDARP